LEADQNSHLMQGHC